jgi:hypothetical protein
VRRSRPLAQQAEQQLPKLASVSPLKQRGTGTDYLEARRLAGWGGDRRSEQARVDQGGPVHLDRRSAKARKDQGDNVTLKTKRGTSATYLKGRLWDANPRL